MQLFLSIQICQMIAPREKRARKTESGTQIIDPINPEISPRHRSSGETNDLHKAMPNGRGNVASKNQMVHCLNVEMAEGASCCRKQVTPFSYKNSNKKYVLILTIIKWNGSAVNIYEDLVD